MRHWIIIAAAVLLANGSAHAAQPDVLFVVADDLNMMIGCYGHPLAKTPNMDRLAERGVRFEQAYCQDPVCNPSRTSFLSGRRPGDKLKDVAWLPDHFRAQGYEVIEVGKVAHSYGISRTAIRWSANEKGGVPRAIELLEARRDKPLFLAVGLAHTHDSVATSEFRKLYDPDKVSWPKEPDDLHQRFPDAAFRGVKEASMSAAERRETVARYLASVSTLDAELGKLLEVLERRKLGENTFVVFTSDHGKHKGVHGIWDKRSLFEVSV
ncbi:MAG: sulfatase-like hydrolase/transferase, partial [Gemmataceae bacterium]